MGNINKDRFDVCDLCHVVYLLQNTEPKGPEAGTEQVFHQFVTFEKLPQLNNMLVSTPLFFINQYADVACSR